MDGKFMSKHDLLIRVALILFALSGIFALTSELLNRWNSMDRVIQKPYVIEVNAYSRPIIVSTPKKGKELLSPFINAVVEPVETSKLTAIESKILAKFGERNFMVARAMAKCESGLNPEAVNWSSHDIGLFQINWDTWHTEIENKFHYSLADMFDVDKNIEVAYWIFDRDGDGNGSVSPWVATGTQCFKENIASL